MSEPKYGECSRLSEIMADISHDSVNRFLLRERYEPKDLFDEIKGLINLEGGILSADDSVLDKPYSAPAKAELIRYFWSGKHHKVVKGINLISLYYSDLQGNSLPLNYRIYDKEDAKTKNEYFREMVLEVLDWGVRPAMVTGDSWYSGVENLEFLKKQELDFLFAVEKNRTVSNEPRVYCQVQTLEIPPDGLVTHLKDFGFVKVFRTVLKHQDDRHYVLYRQRPQLDQTTRDQFQTLHDAHWKIENFHRAVKPGRTHLIWFTDQKPHGQYRKN